VLTTVGRPAGRADETVGDIPRQLETGPHLACSSG
jgi:hypothetical protein